MLDDTAGARLQKTPAGASLLDVGCGGGQNLRWLCRRRPDLRLTGLDLSLRQVARARRRVSKKSARILHGSALQLPFPDAHFDVLLSVASLKHWPDQLRGLSECARVLRPGGRLLVVEVDRSCHLDDARAFVRRWRIPAPVVPLALAWFRTWVAGQGVDLDDARSLLLSLPVDGSASRIPGTPAVLLEGIRR